jgi:hypothetical protein
MKAHHLSEYEAGRAFIIAEYKKMMNDEKTKFGDDEFKVIENKFDHEYYQTLLTIGAERDEKLKALREEFEDKE